MSLIRSGSTLVLLFSSGSSSWPAPGWPSGISFSGGRRFGVRGPRQGRPAVDVLLADQRLRPDHAAGVFAEVLEAGVVDLHHDHRLARDRLRLAVFVAGDLARHGHADRFDFADVGAGDAHLLALDHERAVVEDRAHDVALVAAAGRRRAGRRRRRRRRAARAIRAFLRLLLMARPPGCTGTRSTPEPVKGGSTNGLEPSAAGWVAPPGQRRLTVSPEPSVSNCWLGGIGCSSPPL